MKRGDLRSSFGVACAIADYRFYDFDAGMMPVAKQDVCFLLARTSCLALLSGIPDPNANISRTPNSPKCSYSTI